MFGIIKQVYTNIAKFIKSFSKYINKNIMSRSLKIPKIKRNCLTQQAQTYYPQHLILKKKKLFDKLYKNPQQIISDRKISFNQQTNFGFNITNQYAFVLLHLKSRNNKNMLSINIPQVCIFIDKLPFDIIYSQDNFIRGFKSHDLIKCRLRDLELQFKQRWKTKGYPKQQHITSVFKQKQVLLMSQTDFIIVCKKIKSDPFFKKLQYIKNKLPYVGQQIIVQYDQKLKSQKILKIATQSLLGFRNEQEIQKQLGQDKYLNFLNQKISMTLNYQHNIRISKAKFHYVKNSKNQIFLVNITNLHIKNLTKALKQRQQKMKKRQQQREKLLNLSPQKQKKYKVYENPRQIKQIQSLMKQKFQKIVKKANLLSISQSKNEQIKNQMAFKKLHPEIKRNYKQFLSATDFKRTKQKLFGSTFSNRKPISVPSKYVLRSYNKAKRSFTLQSQFCQFGGQTQWMKSAQM